MSTLSKELRRTLENVVADARRIAEAGAEQALKQLAVHHSESWPAMATGEKALREKLRAHGKQLGDKRELNRTQEISRLTQACAYEHWHRMLFARFLAENNLLIHPDYAEPISLDEIKELAREQNADWLAIAASFAQRMLLEVFRPDDPVLDLILPPETRQKLEDKLARLPVEIFTADDSLGWVYQFWQRDEKDAVNLSEVKIGADELAPVTQLFTEDYMVLFLLHNTLGAWWTAKRQAESRDSSLPGYEWTYLRLSEDGTPAAGSFDGWPRAARDLRVLDPCMGSGHFLAFALPVLARMRAVEDGLTLREAVAGVLSENLFGLELDARCSQIAAFNLALTAWRVAGCHFRLPAMNLACSGLGINASESAWVELAGDDTRARQTMRKLHDLFRQAPTLGSLIDPARLGSELFSADFGEVRALLESALEAEQSSDLEARELAIAAQGLLTAARILASRFVIVATNVPYLGSGKQSNILSQHCDDYFNLAKINLATCFVERCLRFCSSGGTAALVAPQSWLYQPRYEDLRKKALNENTWNFVARLGPGAFGEITGEVVNVALFGLTRSTPDSFQSFAGWDVAKEKSPELKARTLLLTPTQIVSQAAQHKNPGRRIVFGLLQADGHLGRLATCVQGLATSDDPQFTIFFWELPTISNGWEGLMGTVPMTVEYGGRERLIHWDQGTGRYYRHAMALKAEGRLGGWKSGTEARGQLGVLISQMSNMPVTLYTGEFYDHNASVLIPQDPAMLAAIWAYASSPRFVEQVRLLDQSTKPSNGVYVQIPFDPAEWQQIAEDNYSGGLPQPHTTDPTQWLFDGDPAKAVHQLQVAVARLVGYCWPRQTGCAFTNCQPVEPDGLESHADVHGIVCLSSIQGVSPAADRLRALLADAFCQTWSASRLSELLHGWSSLEDWLRDGFFKEHCDIFQDRPFVWHIWDGRNDGFHALVNYHKLAAANCEGRQTLEKLIYTYLGDWITRQRAEVASNVDGADGRLTAAVHLQSELERILGGEAPYDIFVRWKAICEQPSEWAPDLNDGVRLNIRPWLTATLAAQTKPKKGACILRITPKIAYAKDRGKEPERDKTDFPWFADSTDRNNDLHLSLDEKRAARERRNK